MYRAVMVLVVSCTFSGLLFAANAFYLDEVDFFNEDTPTNAERASNIEIANRQWAEPVVMPDGKVSYYTPPGAVLAFLEEPTESNAKSYLQWLNERWVKINKAQQVLRELIKKQHVNIIRAEQ